MTSVAKVDYRGAAAPKSHISVEHERDEEVGGIRIERKYYPLHRQHNQLT